MIFVPFFSSFAGAAPPPEAAGAAAETATAPAEGTDANFFFPKTKEVLFQKKRINARPPEPIHSMKAEAQFMQELQPVQDQGIHIQTDAERQSQSGLPFVIRSSTFLPFKDSITFLALSSSKSTPTLPKIFLMSAEFGSVWPPSWASR